jgi:hypothetical protein
VLTARDHNALVRRVRAWTGFASRLERRLGGLLHADPAAIAVLAGLPGTALVEAPDAGAAAELLVLLDHLNLHAGTRLSVVPLGSYRYRVHGAGPGAGDRCAALRLTAAVRAGASIGYRNWAGRIGRVAVITRDRPAALAAALDAHADNLRRFGRRYAEIVVYDESGPRARRQVRALIEARRAAGTTIRYLGPEEKHALRARLEPAVATGLPYPAAERASVLDALLGRLDGHGTWTGCAATQRNWALWSAAGRRILVCDDDVRPAVLDAPLDALRAAARKAVAAEAIHAERTPGELLEGFLATTEVRAWSTDLLGLLEDTDARLASAVYTGHPDRRAALWLERFLEPSDESVDTLGTGIPLQRVRRGASAAAARKFRGGAFASSGSLDGMEFAVRRGRNEDFSLALSALVTSQGRRKPAEEGGAHILHLRGPRVTGAFTAHREEREGNLVNAVVWAIGEAYAAARPGPFDAGSFREFGHAVLPAELDRQLAAADLGDEVFAEGLAYRHRARAHLRQLEDLAQAVRRAGATLPADLVALWHGDRAGHRAALLRGGVAALHAGSAPPDPVLLECAQVLVPLGLVDTLHPPALRRAWAALSDVERTVAARGLADEARYLRSVGAPARPIRVPAPAALLRRITRKADQTRRLVDDIECELRIPPSAPADSEPVARAREKFRAELRDRVRDEVWLFLAAVPYVAPVRAELGRHREEAR